VYAFSRYTANREVLIEKINNINSIEEYDFEHYDTVMVTYYTKRRRIGINGYAPIIKFHTAQGFVTGYGYRMDGKSRTIGYCNICILVKTNYGVCEKSILDNRDLNKEGKHVNMYPDRIVLTEKNYVEKYEIFEREYRRKNPFPIFGG